MNTDPVSRDTFLHVCRERDGAVQEGVELVAERDHLKKERDGLLLENERLLHEVSGTKAFLEKLAAVRIPTFSEEAAKLLEYMHTGVSEKPRICEDCGKQDASVTRACFKAGRGYLCHDCDR